jgi:hypothetical protein
MGNTFSENTVDLRLCPDYEIKNLWICDIEEDASESDNDFLFLADISADGNAEVKSTGIDGRNFVGRCIFQDVMCEFMFSCPSMFDA